MQDKTIEDNGLSNPKNLRQSPRKLDKLTIPLARVEQDELDHLDYVDSTCYNTRGGSTSGKYVIKIPEFESSTPTLQNFYIKNKIKYLGMT